MPQLRLVTRAELDVTSGPVLEGAPGVLTVTDPIIRATVQSSSSSIACLQFRYLGPTAEQRASSSNIYFHQIGLMLRANDQFNLVYVMWQLKPDEAVVVKVKRGETALCRTESSTDLYHNIARRPFAPYGVGEQHELLAELRDFEGRESEVRVWIDQLEVLRASVCHELLNGLVGRPGFRIDNSCHEFQYRIGQ